MQSQIERDYISAVIERGARLALSANRVMALGGREHQTLGESARRTLLAAACPGLNLSELSHRDVQQQVADLFGRALVLSATKRSAVIQLGEVVCFAGMFGVVSFSLPMLEWPLSKTAFSRHSVIDSSDLLAQIGAVFDGYHGEESLYNYSACNICSAGVLNA